MANGTNGTDEIPVGGSQWVQDIGHLIRTIVTIILIIAGVYAGFKGLIEPAFLGAAFIGVLTFWFGDRFLKGFQSQTLDAYKAGMKAGATVPEQVVTNKDVTDTVKAILTTPIEAKEESSPKVTPEPDLSKPFAYDAIAEDAPKIEPTVKEWFQRQITQEPSIPAIKIPKEVQPYQVKDYTWTKSVEALTAQLEEVFPHSDYEDAVREAIREYGCKSELTAYISTCWNRARDQWFNYGMRLI